VWIDTGEKDIVRRTWTRCERCGTMQQYHDGKCFICEVPLPKNLLFLKEILKEGNNGEEE
jgi:hypothetical protein